MKVLKAFLCSLMATVMIFSCCGAAFAAGEKEEYPMVYLAGFGDTNIYYEDDPEDYHFKVLTSIAYGDLDITSDPEFPQYLIVDSENPERIHPYTEPEADREEAFLYKVWLVFKRMFLLPKTILTKLFEK